MNRSSSSRSFSVNNVTQEGMNRPQEISQPQIIQTNPKIKIKEETDQKVINTYIPQTQGEQLIDRPRFSTYNFSQFQQFEIPNLRIPQVLNEVEQPQFTKKRETIKIISVQEVEDNEKKELKKIIDDLQKMQKDQEAKFIQLKKDAQSKEKENTLREEKMKKQFDTDIKQIKLELEDYKKQLQEKNETIEKMKNEMQSRIKKLNDLLESSKQEYEIEKSKLQNEIISASQRLSGFEVLQSENQKKSDIINEAQSQIEKLKNNIDQLACKANQKNNNNEIIQIQGDLQWNLISKRIFKTPFKCSQCKTVLNNLVNDYFEGIIKDIQEKKIIDNLEKIKMNLLLNCSKQVKLCSSKNCNFFCIWESNLQNLQGNQGYCMLCQKFTIFIVKQ